MPRGRPANKDKIAAKKAEEERQKAEEERKANLTQEEVEAEAEAEAEKARLEEENARLEEENARLEKENEPAEEQTEHEKELELRRIVREKKAAAKEKRSQVFLAASKVERERVKNLSEEAKKIHYASRASKGKVTRKRLQGDLLFPVRTVKKEMKGLFGMKKVFKNNRNERINIKTDAAIFTAAIIEYLTAEVLELSGECAKQMKKSRIVPRYIMSAVRMDDELVELFPRNLTISSAGVLPKPVPAFLSKNNVPRSQWTAGPNEIFRETAISAPSRKSQSTPKGEINNNKE